MKVVYFDIDSLRPDHLGCYGYPRATSPNIDVLAEQGVVFTNSFVADSPCMPARAGTFSGRYGIKNGIVTHGSLGDRLTGVTTDYARMTEGAPLLQEYLSYNGINTACVSSFGRHPSPWFYRGWNTFIDPDLRTWFQQVLAPQVNDAAFAWLDQHHEEDFFLHINYWDPHLPYNQPLEYADQFVGQPFRQYPTNSDIEAHSAFPTLFAPWWFDIEDRDDLDRIISSYDGEIRYTDEYLGYFLDKLDSLGIRDDTLIIVNADHGEQFGEWGAYVDHCMASDATHRVPLIFNWPKHLPTGARIDEFTLNLDLAPTLCELFGLEVPKEWDGTSLVPLMSSESTNWRQRIVFGHGLYTAQRAVRDHSWKYVRTYHPGVWPLPQEALYHIREDPFEQHNIAASHPAVLRSMQAHLFTFEHSRSYLDAACQLQSTATDGSLDPIDPMMIVAERGPAAHNSGKARQPDHHTWSGLIRTAIEIG